MAVGKLSGGEQSRLLLAQLMLRAAQLLVLDEPTNDLDLPTLAVLEEALTGFDGAVLLVTHDRYFLDQVATTILAFDTRPGARGSVIRSPAWRQWEAWRAETAQPRRARPPARQATPARPGWTGSAPEAGLQGAARIRCHRGDARPRRGRAARRARRQRAPRARERRRQAGRAARGGGRAPGRGGPPVRALGRAGGEAQLGRRLNTGWR